MKIVYKSFDDKIFENDWECVKYEQSILNVLHMYNRKGELTNDCDDAFIIKLDQTEEEIENKSFDSAGARLFIQKCKEQNTDCGNIDENCSGWFFWNEFDCGYQYIDDDLFVAFKSIFNDSNI